MVVTEGIAALTSLRSLYDLAREMRDASDPEKLRAAAATMFDLALAAREQTAALQEQRNAAMVELAALKAEVEEAKRFNEQKENYTRERTNTGATIYREQGLGGPQGESPYFCPNCFNHEKLSMLNPAAGENTRVGSCIYACPACNFATQLSILRPKPSADQ